MSRLEALVAILGMVAAVAFFGLVSSCAVNLNRDHYNSLTQREHACVTSGGYWHAESGDCSRP